MTVFVPYPTLSFSPSVCLSLSLSRSFFFLSFLLLVSLDGLFDLLEAIVPSENPVEAITTAGPAYPVPSDVLIKQSSDFLKLLLLLLLRATLRRPSKEHSLLRPTSSVRFTGCFCIFQIFCTLYNFSFNKLINIFLHKFNRYRFSSCFLLQVQLDYFK